MGSPNNRSSRKKIVPSSISIRLNCFCRLVSDKINSSHSPNRLPSSPYVVSLALMSKP